MTPTSSLALAEPEHPRYRLLAPIARGGMAELHLAATHGADGCMKLVAIKRVWPELAHEADFVSMFTDEARLAVRMNHANVVQTFDVGRLDGRLFMAMEFLEGQSLSALLSRLRDVERFPLPLRLSVLSSVLAGLDYAHELRDYDGTPLNVVHRDVSPQNIFVTYNGGVKLLDFGIAKTMAASHQTLPGVMKGRVSYMAPESVRGSKLDRRADLFSMGIMLWEVAAGRRFWHGETETGILRRLIAGTPIEIPPLPDSAPPELEGLVRQALAINPEDRPATAGAMQLCLDQMLASSVDSYNRQLGALVSHAFAVEHQQLRTLIERRLRGEPALAVGDGASRPTSGSFAVVKPVPPEVVPLVNVEDLAHPPWWRRRQTHMAAGLSFVAALGIFAASASGVFRVQPPLPARASGAAPASLSKIPPLSAARSPDDQVAWEPVRERLASAHELPGPGPAHREKPTRPRKRNHDRSVVEPETAPAEETTRPSAESGPQTATAVDDVFADVLTRRAAPKPKTTIDVGNPYE